MRQLTLSLLVGGIGVVLVPSLSKADCATGPEYYVSLNKTSFTVCASSGGRDCGSSVAMLRQNVADGSVVVIGNNCDSRCYVDECVPPGTYRYGYATPYDCSQTGCGGGIVLFREATMPVWTSSECTRTDDVAAPIATSITPPWGTGSADAGVDRYLACNSGGGCTTVTKARRTVRMFDAFALGLGLLFMSLRVQRRRRKSAKY